MTKAMAKYDCLEHNIRDGQWKARIMLQEGFVTFFMNIFILFLKKWRTSYCSQHEFKRTTTTVLCETVKILNSHLTESKRGEDLKWQRWVEYHFRIILFTATNQALLNQMTLQTSAIFVHWLTQLVLNGQTDSLLLNNWVADSVIQLQEEISNVPITFHRLSIMKWGLIARQWNLSLHVSLLWTLAS